MRSINRIWCTSIICIAALCGVSHGILGSGEKEALAQLFSTFPNLGSIATSEFVVDGNIDYGRSWTNNFDSLCLGGDGYEYYGLYCSSGHISGITLTQAWEPGISPDYSMIGSLIFLKNVTVTHYTLSAPVKTLVLKLAGNLPLERMNCASDLLFVNGSFGFPSSLRDLRAALGYAFDLTPFVSLRSLEASLPNPFSPSRYGVWPTSLETLRFYGSVTLTGMLELVGNLTNLKSFHSVISPDSEALLAGNGTVVSESIETFIVGMLQSPGNYSLTVNSSSLKTASIDVYYAPLVLNTPNIQKLTLYTFYNLPPGFTELRHLQELELSGFNVSARAFTNLASCVNLTSLWFDYWTVDPSDLASFLCNITTSNLKLSSITLSSLSAATPGTIFELPACLRAADQLKSLELSGFRADQYGYMFQAASLLTSLPPSIEKLKISLDLDTDANIYNFTQFGHLKELDLDNEKFVGEMRNDFFSFFPNLEKLAITSNSVSGTIPSIGWANMRRLHLICKCSQWTGLDSAPHLQYIQIVSDALETMPNDAYLVNLPELNYFVLFPSRSSIPTPSFWTRLPRLTIFSAYYANFSGPITSSIAAPRLRTLSLVSSFVCGSLPDFDLPTTLDQLYLDDNRFSGTIPPSWANLTIRSAITLAQNELSGTIPSSFLNRRMPNFETATLSHNYFTGPVWNISQNYPSQTFDLQFNNFNICDSSSLPSNISISSCKFLNVSMCPGSASECYAFWNSSCRTFRCTPQTRVLQIPLIEECLAPPPFNFPFVPVPAIVDQCPPPGPPGFRCVNGQWISNGSVSIPSITFPPNGGVIIVAGNLSANGSLTFDGIETSIVVEGCVTNVPTEVTIILKGDEKLKPATILSQKGSNCQIDLSSIPVSLIQDKNNCKQVKSSTKESTHSSLVVVFELDSHKCNTKWIILGSVLGGIVFVFTVGLTISYHLSPQFRAFVRSCKPKEP